MSRYASTSVPKPKNWQDFESNSCILFKCILKDPGTSTHGRGGQAQHGVDIYGRRGGKGAHWVGVQCKLKGDLDKVTRSELETEVAKAKRFTPNLSDFIVITTAPDDATIQAVARAITHEHQKFKLFSVSVWGWQTLEREITKYSEAIEAFHPDLTPFSQELHSISKETLSLGRESREDNRRIIGILEDLLIQRDNGETAVERSSAADEAVEQNIHSEIDGYRDLLRQGQAMTAKRLLECLKGRVWDFASGRVRFRIVTNIGAAYLELGEESLAAEAFMEAINYDPDDRIGMANLALAHLLRKETEQAVAAAQTALARGPENAAAAAHLISGRLSDLTVANPFSLVPEALQETPVVLASAINFLCHRGNVGWRALAREASSKHPDEKVLRRRAAEAVLEEALSSERLGMGGATAGGITMDDLRDATTTLQRLWDEALTSETRGADIALAHNLARALWSLNERRGAATVLDQALQRTSNDQDLRELRAGLHFEAGEPEAAVALIGDNAKYPSLFMQAQALLQRNPQNAREILQRPAFSDASDAQRLSVVLLVVKSFFQEGEREKALALAERLVIDYEWSAEPLLELAHMQRLLGRDGADQTLTQAVEKLRTETNFLERFDVASALEDVGRHDESISVLEGHVDMLHDSPALRLLLFSYINAGRRTTAYDVLTRLPAEVAEQPPYLRASVALSLNRKDFAAALDTIDKYLLLRPDDLEMRLRWSSLCFRLNQRNRVQDFMKGDVEALSGTPELEMELAHWLDRLGFPERALELGYSVFLEHSALPQVHLRYMGLLLRPGRSDAVPLDVESIDNNVAFEIDDGRGGKSWFVIEPDAKLRKDETYIAPDLEIAHRAKGLGVNDAIRWGGERRDWTIHALKHKYIYALHTSMEKFERHFPMEQGMRLVNFDPEANEPFQALFNCVKERHDSIQRVFDVLTDGLIPIHLPASALGMDIVQARYALHEAGRTYRVCAGTQPEREDALVAVRSNEKCGCVVDAVTLTLVRRLGLENAVREVCGPIGLTGSTRDVFWHQLHELEEEGGPSLSVFWRDGSYYRAEPKQTDWDQAIQIRQADLCWIDRNAVILPAEGSVDPPKELRSLDQAVGHDFMDDMLAAQGSGRLLLCQDQAYRAVAGHFLGVKSSWLQPVLMVARDEGFLSREEYAKSIASLIDFGDQCISIDSDVLLAATREDKGALVDFDRIVALLGGLNAEMLSHIIVAVDFLGGIWTERPNEIATSKQTGLVLKNLLKGRSNWREVVAILRRIFIDKIGLNIQLDSYVVGWLQGHFLVPFGTKSLPLAHFEQLG